MSVDEGGGLQVQPDQLHAAAATLQDIAGTVQECGRTLGRSRYDGSGFDDPAQQSYLTLVAAWLLEVSSVATAVGRRSRSHASSGAAYATTEISIAAAFAQSASQPTPPGR